MGDMSPPKLLVLFRLSLLPMLDLLFMGSTVGKKICFTGSSVGSTLGRMIFAGSDLIVTTGVSADSGLSSSSTWMKVFLTVDDTPDSADIAVDSRVCALDIGLSGSVPSSGSPALLFAHDQGDRSSSQGRSYSTSFLDEGSVASPLHSNCTLLKGPCAASQPKPSPPGLAWSMPGRGMHGDAAAMTAQSAQAKGRDPRSKTKRRAEAWSAEA
mmetsp:Transcript_51960/g.133986  ORF Transcript_51960/g.133986 Transcript_51960/m.133986 type:complete len:212 (+) Transcript_51960:632-1267(+)